MNLQRLRYLREIVRRDLNLTAAAAALHTSQPGVSRQILEMEEELGCAIFERRGRRLTGLTEPGRAALTIAERVLDDLEALRRVGHEWADGEQGTLTIATTHTQARYTLPTVVAAFRRQHPQIGITLRQGEPDQVVRSVLDGKADLAVATEAVSQVEQLIATPFLEWSHVAVVPPDHPLAHGGPPSAAALAAFPLLTYDTAFAGRKAIDLAFADAGLAPQVAISALDADVIKTYVRLGLGVGLIASVAFNSQADAPLIALNCKHLFGAKTSYVALPAGKTPRRFVTRFIAMLIASTQQNQAPPDQGA
jgi:LysR family cys regulon transcriptional activator